LLKNVFFSSSGKAGNSVEHERRLLYDKIFQSVLFLRQFSSG
jgi:hypothetical protein